MIFILVIYLMMTAMVVFIVPFPSEVDELQHMSVVRALYEHPTLFPDWDSYRILRPDNLTRWSDTHNYINHPSPYYLLIAPLFAITENPVVFRLVNVLLSTAALLIVMLAVHRRFSPQTVPPALFAVIAASYPKAAVVGGMVNNDNLAAVAAAMLFGGLLGLPGAGWWIMAGLAVAGWTKLTAFIGLATVAGMWLGLNLLSGRIRLNDRRIWLAAAGVMLGASHYIFTFLRIGQILWVNEANWTVPMADRLDLDLSGFAQWFFIGLTMKWPAAEFAYPLWLSTVMILSPIILAVFGLRYRETRSWTIAYLVGTAVLVAMHFGFGWRSFVKLGDLSTMQARYYNILWPGIALAATTAITRLSRHRQPVMAAAATLFLASTMLGNIISAWLFP